MRVYGSSPLYSYVELVFRAKRLFIVSFIIALLISVGVVAFKSGSYNAKAIVLLSGSTPSVVGNNNNDDPLRGSIQFKLNILNLCLKDPKFMRDAFKNGGLDKGKTEPEFDKFCKDATAAIAPASAQNLLELSCHWKTSECADIISTFYNDYSQLVGLEESSASTAQTKVIRGLLEEYTLKQQDQEKKIVKQQEGGVNKNFYGDYSLLLQQKREADNSVKVFEGTLATLRRQQDAAIKELAKTSKTIDGSKTVTGISEDNQYRLLEARVVQMSGELSDLRKNNTDMNPKVRQKIEDLANAKKELDLRKTVFGNNPKDSTNTRIEQNPNWLKLDARRADLSLEIENATGQLNNANREAAQAAQAAMVSPMDQFNFRWSTIYKDLYATIRSNLSVQLEQAMMDEKRDKALHNTEMKVFVEPVSELEVAGGAKSLVLVAIGPIIGLILAFAFSLLTESLDHTLRTPIEVERFLGKPVLAVLPRLDTGKEAANARRLEGTQSSGYISS